MFGTILGLPRFQANPYGAATRPVPRGRGNRDTGVFPGQRCDGRFNGVAEATIVWVRNAVGAVAPAHRQTCQAEAIASDDLADILRTAIETRIDRGAFTRVLQRERMARRELLDRLGEDQ
jgi:hypothetical protein